MLKFKIEQIALYPEDSQMAHDFLKALGLTEWVQDTVVATGQVFKTNGANTADLSFNYQAGNGSDAEAGKPLELEVLQYVKGRNWMDYRDRPSVSHLGMHVTEEQLAEFAFVMDAYNVEIAQTVITQSHTNEAIKDSRRYKYVIYDTHGIIGVDLKFIVRLPYSPSA